MRKKVDLKNWKRKEVYEFFTGFDEPLYGVTIRLTCTDLYDHCKANGHSFYLSYLHRILTAVNESAPLKLRIEDGEVYAYDRIDVSATVDRPDGTFGFSYIQYDEDYNTFERGAREVIEEVRQSNSLFPPRSSEHVIHFSALPWIDFSAVSHARHFAGRECIPKFSIGKMTENEKVKSMAFSVHVHHGLVDGADLGAFLDLCQQKFDE